MKKIKFYLIPFLILFYISGCEKEKININSCEKEKVCDNLPEGLYQGWFTDEGEDPINVPLYLHKLDENTLVISITNDASYGPYVKKKECTIGGVIDGKACLGEIVQEDDGYMIKGSYSYIGGSGTRGTFEIIPN